MSSATTTFDPATAGFLADHCSVVGACSGHDACRRRLVIDELKTVTNCRWELGQSCCMICVGFAAAETVDEQ
jgi:hypothetical protein